MYSKFVTQVCTSDTQIIYIRSYTTKGILAKLVEAKLVEAKLVDSVVIQQFKI